MVQISIANVVGHLDFQRELELAAVADLLRESPYVSKVKYKPAENHWLQTWFESPASGSHRYVSFYRSGTAIATGCSSVNEFQQLANLVIEVMEPVVEDKVHQDVKNIVATGTLGTTLNLSRLAIHLGLDSVEYEPEQFPGLIYRDQQQACVFLVFSSGKIICMGLNTVEAAQAALQNFTSEML